MLPTILISAVILALVVLAVRRVRKKGTCDNCEGCSGDAVCHCKDAACGGDAATGSQNK